MTLGYTRDLATGRVVAGEMDQIWIPNSPRPGTAGVILYHGSGNPHGYMDPVSQPSSEKLAAAIARAGIPCISGDFGGQTWGNDTAVNDGLTAWSVLKAKFPTIRTDKFAVVGGSMGGCNAAHLSQQNPTKVTCVVGLIPLWDLVSFYNANPGSVQAEIAAAWGVSTGAALPARADTKSRSSLVAGIPHLCGYSSVDNIVLPAWSTNYATAVGATTLITDSTYGHSDAAIGGMPIPTVGQFLVANEGR